MQSAPEARHGGTNKGLGVERIPKLLDLAAAPVAGPQECRARNSNGWLLAAPPEPLTGRKAGASLVVSPYAEELSDEKAS